MKKVAGLIITGLVMAAICQSSSYAATTQTFQDANNLYKGGQFAEAAQIYTELADHERREHRFLDRMHEIILAAKRQAQGRHEEHHIADELLQ